MACHVPPYTIGKLREASDDLTLGMCRGRRDGAASRPQHGGGWGVAWYAAALGAVDRYCCFQYTERQAHAEMREEFLMSSLRGRVVFSIPDPNSGSGDSGDPSGDSSRPGPGRGAGGGEGGRGRGTSPSDRDRGGGPRRRGGGSGRPGPTGDDAEPEPPAPRRTNPRTGGPSSAGSSMSRTTISSGPYGAPDGGRVDRKEHEIARRGGEAMAPGASSPGSSVRRRGAGLAPARGGKNFDDEDCTLVTADSTYVTASTCTRSTNGGFRDDASIGSGSTYRTARRRPDGSGGKGLRGGRDWSPPRRVMFKSVPDMPYHHLTEGYVCQREFL